MDNKIVKGVEKTNLYLKFNHVSWHGGVGHYLNDFPGCCGIGSPDVLPHAIRDGLC
jgi:hypothetical protein